MLLTWVGKDDEYGLGFFGTSEYSYFYSLLIDKKEKPGLENGKVYIKHP